MMNKNLIAFRKGLVTVETGNTPVSNELIAEFQHLLMSHGFMMSEDAYTKLSFTSEDNLTSLISDITKHFIETIGDTNAKELKQLLIDYTTTAEYIQALRLKKFENILVDDVYESMLTICGFIWSNVNAKTEDVVEIPQVYETTKFTMIEFADEAKFKSIFTDLIKIGTALTPTDFEIVEWFAKEYGQGNLMPDSIPFKENLCMVASLGLDVPVKTATDVLRIATYMSNGTTDLILPKKMIQENAWSPKQVANPKRETAKFKKFKRSERRYLLGMLEQVVDVKEMTLKQGRWIKLGEILHPGEYAKRFPLSAKAFNQLRNTKVKSWYADLDAAFLVSFEDGMKKLSERPGEFARRLDSLLRTYFQETDRVLEAFVKISAKISPKVLWELYSHFSSRSVQNQGRSIWIKGARKPTPLPTLDVMDSKLIDTVQDAILTMITKRFASLEKLGNVFIDEELKKIPVPTNMRTLQDATKVVVRGSRMPLLQSKKVFRPYIHWTKGVDLDLSMSFIDKKGKTFKCDFTNTSPHSSIQHSGDVIPRVEGKWAEYIDINLKDNPYKYGLLTVHNFAGTTLEDVGAVIGFMERDNLQSSKKWSPATIENSFKVSAQGSNVNLLIIDFENMEWILVDEDSDGVPVESRNNIVKYIEELSKEPKLSVYDVLDMHVSVRGNRIDEITEENVENVDVKFTFDDFSTSYEKIASYML